MQHNVLYVGSVLLILRALIAMRDRSTLHATKDSDEVPWHTIQQQNTFYSTTVHSAYIHAEV